MKVIDVHLEDLRAKIGEPIAASIVWNYEQCGRINYSLTQRNKHPPARLPWLLIE
jgi:hypothetical protein